MKTTLHILLLSLSILLSGCVDENDVFDNDFIENDQNAIQTALITSYLNEEFIENTINSENCVGLNFPIQLGYNTNQIISINNFESLEEIAENQTSSFHLNTIVFPITITNNNQEQIITSLSEYSELLNSCNVVSLRNTLLQKTSSCFILEYPLSILNALGNESLIENEESFISFLENTSNTFIPEFVYPIQVNDTRIVDNNFELYEVLNTCIIEECFEISVNSEEINPNLYAFEVVVNPEDQNTISWFVDGQLLTNETNTTIEQQFQNRGTYEICATVISDNENCPEERTTCTTITVDCPTFVLSSNSRDSREYTFTIDTNNPAIDILNDSIDISNLIWTVQKANLSDDLIIFNEEGSSEVSYVFTESDTYQVCAISRDTTECEVEVCMIIDVAICPIIEIFSEFVSLTGRDNESTFRFTASGADGDVQYMWELSEGLPQIPGNGMSGEMNQFFEANFSPGSHEICVEVLNPDCSLSRIEECIQIEVADIN